eukprot:3644797-Amphidinium_carterae.2
MAAKACKHSPTTPEGLVPPMEEPTEVSMEEITNALKRKRISGSHAGGSRASSAETALEKRLATEKETIPPPPRHDQIQRNKPTAGAKAGTTIPASVPTKAAPKVPATLKDMSALKQTPQKAETSCEETGYFN